MSEAPPLLITPQMEAVFGPMRQLTVLQKAVVTPAAATRYRVLFLRLLTWALQWGLVLNTQEAVETNLPLYFEEQYAEDEPVSTGDYVLAAFIFFLPQYGTNALCGLPLCRQSLRGWRRKKPASSRLPLPWEVVAMMANWMIGQGRWTSAVLMLTMFQAYLRPGEPFKIRVGDVVKPVFGSSSRHWALILHPLEIGVASKTRAFDETSVIDGPVFQFLGPALERLVRGRHPDEPLFVETAQGFLALFREAAEFFDLDTCISRVIPYRLRHGGASFDIISGARTLPEVGKRGRWRIAASVRRYEKGGRVGQLLARLPEAKRTHSLLCAERVGDVVLGKKPPLDPARLRRC